MTTPEIELFRQLGNQLQGLDKKLDGHMGAIHEKVNEAANRISRLEENQHETRRDSKTVHKRIDDHLTAEEAAFADMAAQIHTVRDGMSKMNGSLSYLKGVVEEREKWSEKAGIVRLVHGVLKFFGINWGQ